MSQKPTDLSSLRIDRTAAPPARRSGAAWWIAAAVVVVAAVALWFVLGGRARTPEVRVAVATSAGSGGSQGITANGYVVARTKASVSAKVAGRMSFLGVREGSVVKRGEVIARIESADYDAALLAARATASEAEAAHVQGVRDLERARELRTASVISERELEDAQTREKVLAAQLEGARARVGLAEVNVENTRVRAPFDGTVLRKDAEVGEFVAPSAAGGGARTAIVTMADLATLEVEVDVNEAYIAQVRNGQEARIVLDAYPDTSFAGHARQVVPTADRQKATVLVKVSIDDRDPRILPEMGAKVVFLREGSAAPAAAATRVTVPPEAIVRDGGGAKVWVVSDGRVRTRSVEPGRERGGRIEIQSGLQGGESVVLDPPPGLKDGARVRVAGA